MPLQQRFPLGGLADHLAGQNNRLTAREVNRIGYTGSGGQAGYTYGGTTWIYPPGWPDLTVLTSVTGKVMVFFGASSATSFAAPVPMVGVSIDGGTPIAGYLGAGPQNGVFSQVTAVTLTPQAYHTFQLQINAQGTTDTYIGPKLLVLPI